MCTTGEIHVLIGTKRIEVASQQFLFKYYTTDVQII